MKKLRVIGAGVTGLVAAYSFARAGLAVSLHEKGASLGPQTCSWWAGGMLAPWCERESAEEVVIPLGAEAFDFWREVADDYAQNGSLVVTQPRDLSELKRFSRRTTGFDEVGKDEIAALEPALATRFERGLYFSQEAHITPRKALIALLSKLEGIGVPIHYNSDGYENVGAEEQIVDCTGLRARAELEDLRGVRGEMLHLRCEGLSLSRPVRLLHPRIPLYIVPRGEGVFMVGATMIESSARNKATVRSTVELLNAAYALHPAFAEAEILEIGADVRPAFPDNLPKVVVRDGRIYLNGAYRHGFLLSPSLARAATDLILNGKRDERLIA